MRDDQLELFGEEVAEKVPGMTAVSTCSKCVHICAVEFSKKNLFFCEAQKGGRYGKKIKKTAPSCSLYEEATEPLRAWDGYYGGYRDEIKR